MRTGAPAAKAEHEASLLVPREAPRFLLAGLLLLATLAVYYPVVHHDFLNYDDNEYITENPHVRAGLSRQSLLWAFTSFELSNWHPVTWLSHMLDCQLFGLNSAEAHAMNVLLHAANVLLLFFLLQQATRRRWRSLLVAALFAVHPLNVETVAWVAERKSLLSLLFSLLAVVAYGWYVRRPNRKRYLFIVAAFVLALMSKPMSVSLPVILLLLDYWPLARFEGGGAAVLGGAWHPGDPFWTKLARLVLEKAPLFLMSLGSAVVTVAAQRAGGSVAAEAVLPLSLRLKNAAVSYVEYIRKMLWPDKLAVFYPHPEKTLVGWKVAAAVLILAAITALALKFRRHRYLPVGWLTFLVTLLPVIGIVQVGRQAMADRYAYVPLIGLFIILVWGASSLAARLSLGVAAPAAAALGVLFVLALATANTLPYWRNSLTLFTRARQVATRPDRVIEDNLGQALYSVGRYDEAVEHFKLAVALDPHDAWARYNIGTYLLRQGQTQAAIQQFQAALRYGAANEVAGSCHNNLGAAFLQLGDYAAAQAHYTAALQLDPYHYRSLLGRGQAYYSQGRFREAADDFARAVKISADPLAFLWWGKSLEALSDRRGAITAYREALRRNPALAEAAARLNALEKRQPN